MTKAVEKKKKGATRKPIDGAWAFQALSGKAGICPYCIPSDDFDEKGHYKDFKCRLSSHEFMDGKVNCNINDWGKCPLNPSVLIHYYEGSKELYVTPVNKRTYILRR